MWQTEFWNYSIFHFHDSGEIVVSVCLYKLAKQPAPNCRQTSNSLPTALQFQENVNRHEIILSRLGWLVSPTHQAHRKGNMPRAYQLSEVARAKASPYRQPARLAVHIQYLSGCESMSGLVRTFNAMSDILCYVSDSLARNDCCSFKLTNFP